MDWGEIGNTVTQILAAIGALGVLGLIVVAIAIVREEHDIKKQAHEQRNARWERQLDRIDVVAQELRDLRGLVSSISILRDHDADRIDDHEEGLKAAAIVADLMAQKMVDQGHRIEGLDEIAGAHGAALEQHEKEIATLHSIDKITDKQLLNMSKNLDHNFAEITNWQSMTDSQLEDIDSWMRNHEEDAHDDLGVLGLSAAAERIDSLERRANDTQRWEDATDDQIEGIYNRLDKLEEKAA